jgi:hypothetical protein
MRRPVPVQFMLKAGRGMPGHPKRRSRFLGTPSCPLQTKKGPYWRPKGERVMLVLRWL